MPNETPAIEAPQEQTSNVAPNLDAELDAALSKSFPNNGIPNETTKIEEPKVEVKAEAKVEDKPESKPESKKEDKPADPEKPLLTPEEVEKIDPKDKGAWGAIKNANKKAHSMIQQKDAEIAKLKSVVAEKGALSLKEVEALKAENAELAKYRAMVDIQADPEFLSKFDQPIEKNVESIKGMLVEMGISQAVIGQVDFTNTKLMSEIITHVGEHRDQFAARKLQRKVDDLLELNDKRNETLAEQKENYKETLEARKKQAFEKDTESEGKALKRLEAIAAAKDKAGNTVFPFLSKMEVKDNATQPEIDQINGHNKMVDLMAQKVQQAFKMNEPEERMEVAVAAAAAHYLNAINKSQTARIKSLEAEIQKISTVSTETERTKPASVKRNSNGSHLPDLDEALNAHFNR